MEILVKVGEFAPELQVQIDREFKCISPEAVLGNERLRCTVRGIITRSNCRVPVELIEQLPSLQVISTSGVGYDGIPVELATRRKITVTNTPGVLDAAVCELGIGLLLAMLRQIPRADEYVRTGMWQQGLFPLTTSLHGMRVGIVGLGRIGNGMARRLEPFGVTISYGGGGKRDVPWNHVRDLSELAASSDVLILCCKGGDETHHLINESVLAALDDGWLVNMARGSVVDERVLCQVLRHGRLRGAALDVFEKEPLGDSPLRNLPNVVLSPHAGSATQQARQLMLRLALDNLHAVLNGGAAVTPIRL
jgi:lactate dehydrogenase-like 2-hydroxyacid dehydrogenase